MFDNLFDFALQMPAASLSSTSTPTSSSKNVSAVITERDRPRVCGNLFGADRRWRLGR